MSNEADEARRKFRHRAVTTQAGRAVTGQSKHYSDYTEFQNHRDGEEHRCICECGLKICLESVCFM